MKKILLIIFILLCAVFIYLKVQVNGNPNSNFNKTTRVTLGGHPFMRAVLGLHSSGDARAEYLNGKGPIIIEWFAPETENVDPGTFNNLAKLVQQYTGRATQVLYAGGISDSIVPVSNLASFKLKAGAEVPSGSALMVYLTENYTPRPDIEISSTYQETGMVLSLTALRDFVKNDPQDLNKYIFSSMLHEFGNQIGLPEQGTDPRCIMNLHAGIDGSPLELHGYSEPQDFCPAEQLEIQTLKAEFNK